MSEATNLLANQNRNGVFVKRDIYLYTTHFLQMFNARLWDFAVPILCLSIWTHTLLPPALIQFAFYCGQVPLMPLVGKWIDQTERMRVMATAIVTQAVFIMINCCIFFALYMMAGGAPKPYPDWSVTIIVLFILLMITAIFGGLAQNAAKISIEKDWIVAICGKDKKLLTSYNAKLRQVDLISKIGAPTIFGIIMGFFPIEKQVYLGLSIVFGWNSITLLAEYFAAVWLYKSEKVLHTKKTSQANTDTINISIDKPSKKNNKSSACEYMQHKVFLASISYSFLYMTVLSNGTMMTAYLMWAGVPQGLLGFVRGLGAICGIIGSCISPRLQWRFGLIRTGVISLCLFFLFIIPAMIVNFHVGASLFELEWIMMGSVVISRIWLWIFDLSHTMVMQNNVDETEIGKINGWQESITQVNFAIISFLALIFSDPSQFRWLALVSVASVAMTVIGWTTWAYGAKNVDDEAEGVELFVAVTGEERLTSESKIKKYHTFSASPKDKN